MQWFDEEFLEFGKECFDDDNDIILKSILFNGGIVFNFKQSKEFENVDEDTVYKYNEIKVYVDFMKYINAPVVVNIDFLKLAKIEITSTVGNGGLFLAEINKIVNKIFAFLNTVKRVKTSNKLRAETIDLMRAMVVEGFTFTMDKDEKEYVIDSIVSKDNVSYYLLKNDTTALLPVSKIASKEIKITEVKK